MALHSQKPDAVYRDADRLCGGQNDECDLARKSIMAGDFRDFDS